MALSVPPRGRRAPSRRLFDEPLAAKVPEITAWFWVVKILTTAAGEATSDALKTLGNIVGGGAEVLLFAVGLVLQFRSRRYTAIAYWFLAYAIATFGTGVADFLHLDVGIPYAGTTLLWAAILAAVFWLWYRSEGTLSIHSIVTTRRELYYWATVFATFALGTALGDFTATALGLGYLASGILFAVVILIPAVAYRWFGMNSIAAFWFAYVVTRPLGASFADYISKPPSISGIGFGDPQTALVLGLTIVACVAYLAIARPDVQQAVEGSPALGPDAGGVLLAPSSPMTGAAEAGEADDLAWRAGGGGPVRGAVAPGRRYVGGWPPREDGPAGAPSLRPRSPEPGPARRPGGSSPGNGDADTHQFDPLLRDLLAWGLVEPARPAADNDRWHLAEGAQHRLEDLHTRTETHGSPLVYFDRLCAGCRRRRLTRLHDGVHLCDACVAGAQPPGTATGAPSGTPRTPGTPGPT